MTTPLKYIGIESDWFETTVTGAPTHWRKGDQKEVPTANVAALLATGFFQVLPGPALTAYTDPLTGVTTILNPATGLPMSFGTKAPRIRLATNHAFAGSSGGAITNGTTQVSGTNRLGFVVNTDIHKLQFIFAQLYCIGGSSMPTWPVGNALNLYACIERNNINIAIPIGTPTGAKISSSGRSANAIADMTYVTSAPTSTGTIASGDTLYYRVYTSVGAGERWNANGVTDWANYLSTGNNRSTDFVASAGQKTGTDETFAWANQVWSDFGTSQRFYAATAILGEQLTPRAVCLLSGDSIALGAGAVVGKGYLGQALEAANVAYTNAGIAGLELTAHNASGGSPAVMLAPYADHVIIHGITNDIHASGTVANLATAKAAFLGYIREMSMPTNKIWLATMVPRTKSSDSWTTYAGQFFNIPGNGAPQITEPVRVLVNNWLRDTSASGAVAYLNANLTYANVAGVFDPALLVERNLDGSALTLIGGQQTGAAGSVGGYWKLGCVSDGIHPNATGCTTMVPSVPVASFTLF